MSVDFYATPFFGIVLEESDLQSRTPNLLWKKHKFDPETGEKIEQFKIEDIDKDELAEKFNLDVYSGTEGHCIYFGKKLGKRLELNSDEYVEFKTLSEYAMDELRQKIGELLGSINATARESKYFVVGYCSY